MNLFEIIFGICHGGGVSSGGVFNSEFPPSERTPIINKMENEMSKTGFEDKIKNGMSWKEGENQYVVTATIRHSNEYQTNVNAKIDNIQSFKTNYDKITFDKNSLNSVNANLNINPKLPSYVNVYKVPSTAKVTFTSEMKGNKSMYK